MWTPRECVLTIALAVSVAAGASVALAQNNCGPLAAGEVMEWSGRGPTLSEPIQLQAGLYRNTVTHQGSRNIIGRLEPQADSRSILLVNETGTQNLTTGVRVPQDGTYLLNVTSADGPWTIQLQRQ